MSGFTIGKLAKAVEVRIDTIRFYEKLGLLSPQRRPSGFREYTQNDLDRLTLIRRARSLGFSLEEIGQLLLLETQTDGATLEASVDTHLRIIDLKIDELRSWRNALLKWQRERRAPDTPSFVATLGALSGKPPAACVTGCSCTNPRAC